MKKRNWFFFWKSSSFEFFRVVTISIPRWTRRHTYQCCVAGGRLRAGQSGRTFDRNFPKKTQAVLMTGASVNGRVLTQTTAMLDQATVTSVVVNVPPPVKLLHVASNP
jgi:hypothetical protein